MTGDDERWTQEWRFAVLGELVLLTQMCWRPSLEKQSQAIHCLALRQVFHTRLFRKGENTFRKCYTDEHTKLCCLLNKLTIPTLAFATALADYSLFLLFVPTLQPHL